VIKIAVTTSRLSDCLPLLDVGAQENSGQTVVIGMGEPGIATRVLAAKFGSAWTYAGALRDIGQVTTSELVDRFRFRSLTRDTAVYGIAGRPVSHSVSPAMHNAAMREARLDAVYLPLAAADVDDFQTFARGIGLLGASVTIPFKVSLFDRMDEADPLAQRIGAINTVRVRGDRWEGTNTDVIGFLKPLDRRGIALSGLHASILGAGGSARAVAMALAARGAKVRIHARRDEQSAAVAQAADVEVGAWPVAPGSWDLLVNCTPVGMFPDTDASPLGIGEVRGPIVYDLIYNPARTKLLRDAASNGSATIGGLEMLVGQAQEQFRWWTGIEPSSKVMQAAATARLREFSTDEDHVL
jgi:3-dehydroquinate dehydratase/shikimate dehydrogenase